MTARIKAFFAVGAVGLVVQLGTLATLTRAEVALPLATALAVEAAVLHNFVWHERWTWRDRAGHGRWTVRLLRFHTSTALVSIVVNVALTWAIARLLHLSPVVSNVMAVASASVANYLAADRWVFARATSLAIAAWLTAGASAWASPAPDAVEAWHSYVRAAEQRQGVSQVDCAPDHEPVGESVRVRNGTIYRWSSCTLVRGITVRALVDALLASGTPPPQEDVLESRLLARDGDRLRVYLKLERRAVISVSYDTEHDMTFRRNSDTLATSRSVATTIRQSDGGDHGFLWRLNSYWWYRQVGPDVRVELVTLSLSRGVPLLLRPMAAPLITNVARESMVRTLEAVRRYLEGDATARYRSGDARVDAR